MIAKEHRIEILRARRALVNFRAMVRRPANWTGALEDGYATAFAAIVIVEDAYGIDTAGPYSDRLTTLRQEAGLTPEAIINAERAAMARADEAKAGR